MIAQPEIVWRCDDEVITAEDLVNELKKALKEKDKPGIRLLKSMLFDMGADKKYPEYFL